MKNLHLTRYVAMASIALMGTTAAWADDTGWRVSDGTLTLDAGQSSISITSEISGVTNVIVNRGTNSPLTAYSTIMLPVDVVLKDNSYVDAAYLPMDYNKSENTLTFSSTTISELEANKPYIIKVNSTLIGTNTLEFNVKSGSSVKPTSAGEHSAAGSCFTMKGVYETKQWNGSGLTQDYGFSADDKGGVSVGQFVRIQNNSNSSQSVTLLPARAYLTCTKPQLVNGLGKVAEESLPDVINVRFVDKDGGTLSIGKMNTKTGDIQMQDRYYDLKGRKLNGKPQNKVMYVNKKVIKH